MKIANISGNTAFGKLILNVDTKVLKTIPIKNEYETIKKIFKDNGFSKKENVNVILNYDAQDKCFFGIIQSKKQGIPNNPHYKHVISSKPEVVKEFKKWLDDWNYMYSPKALKELEEFNKQAMDMIRKYRQSPNSKKV